MSIAVAEEACLNLGAAIGLVEANDVHIKIHRSINIVDHQINVAKPPRLENFSHPLTVPLDCAHGSTPTEISTHAKTFNHYIGTENEFQKHGA